MEGVVYGGGGENGDVGERRESFWFGEEGKVGGWGFKERVGKEVGWVGR